MSEFQEFEDSKEFKDSEDSNPFKGSKEFKELKESKSSHHCGIGCSFSEHSPKTFSLVHIIMPLHARKPYHKPWLQHTRGSDGERSPIIFSSEKKQSPRYGGEML